MLWGGERDLLATDAVKRGLVGRITAGRAGRLGDLVVRRREPLLAESVEWARLRSLEP